MREAREEEEEFELKEEVDSKAFGNEGYDPSSPKFVLPCCTFDSVLRSS